MRRLPVICLLVIFAAGAAAAQPFVLEDFNDPDALVEREAFSLIGEPQHNLVPQGVTGSAISVQIQGRGDRVRLAVDPDQLEDNASWDGCNGVSLMVRGDGSDEWGCVQFGGSGSNGRYTYSLYVPLRDRSWHEVRAHFSELVSESPVHAIGTEGSLPPSGIARVTFGTRWHLYWNNSPMPSHAFSVDDIRLIADAPQPGPPPSARPLEEVIQRLRDREPVAIQCMGDSITAGTGLPDRDTQRYAVLLQQVLRDRLGYDDIVCYSRAVGGAKLSDARFWYRRDFDGVSPDLVTICYGYNDKSGAHPADFYRFQLDDYIDRIARVTGGTAAVCPITTLPGGGPRFVMMDDFARQVRDLCAERGDVTAIDLAARIKALGRQGWGGLLGDMAHPNIEGHEWLAGELAAWIVERVKAQ